MNNLSFINNLPNDILCKIYTDTIKMKNRIDFDNNKYKYVYYNVIEELEEVFSEVEDMNRLTIIEYIKCNEYYRSQYLLEYFQGKKIITGICYSNSTHNEFEELHIIQKNNMDIVKENIDYNKRLYEDYYEKLWKYTNKIKKH